MIIKLMQRASRLRDDVTRRASAKNRRVASLRPRPSFLHAAPSRALRHFLVQESLLHQVQQARSTFILLCGRLLLRDDLLELHLFLDPARLLGRIGHRRVDQRADGSRQVGRLDAKRDGEVVNLALDVRITGGRALGVLAAGEMAALGGGLGTTLHGQDRAVSQCAAGGCLQP